MKKDVRNECVVAILSWNTVDITPNAIDSLLRQSFLPTILVIDNGSEDGSYEQFDAKYGDKIKLIRNKKNLGFSGGANTAFKWAKENGFKYVALLNSDAVAEEDWVKELLSSIKEDGAGITTSKILKLNGKELDTTGEELFYWGLSSPRGRGEMDKGQYDKSQRVFGGSGGASLYSIEMIDDIGMFDEDFFAYYEDADLSFRANSLGWSVVYNPKAIVRHEIGASSSKVGGMTLKMGIKNQPMLLIKNVPMRYLPAVMFRFSFLWFGNVISGVKAGQGRHVLRGIFKLIFLIPKKTCQRILLQHKRRKRGIKAKDIRLLMTPGLPAQVSSFSTVRLARKIVFWEK